MMTGDGHQLPPFLRRDIERMIRHYEFICIQIAEVETDRKVALTDEMNPFPYRDKVERLATLGSVGETTATVLVADVPPNFESDTSRFIYWIGTESVCERRREPDRGINKAGTSWHGKRSWN